MQRHYEAEPARESLEDRVSPTSSMMFLSSRGSLGSSRIVSFSSSSAIVAKPNNPPNPPTERQPEPSQLRDVINSKGTPLSRSAMDARKSTLGGSAAMTYCESRDKSKKRGLQTVGIGALRILPARNWPNQPPTPITKVCSNNRVDTCKSGFQKRTNTHKSKMKRKKKASVNEKSQHRETHTDTSTVDSTRNHG